ncbi:chemotaxis protein CheA [Nitrosomonas sp. Nm166]|uniref:chemotaxis protein CheA n=1 Tax=Nitrosomonas sp. Nm166 TaxID=1881054 RepID=UPI0008E7C2BC|nr:ATP-binding protein [Nitrosomonas sp. Nm166]SFE63892.1 Chemotaxis protein histidine kinase CheA [Nitrosomonas sp. Nm166]
MTARSKLNIASIIGIKEGIYQIFSLIDQNLDAYSKHPDKITPIRDCKHYIHQLNGLLEMLRLSSITLVSEKMEQLIEALLTKKIASSAQICETLKQSNKALLYYLNELIDGKEENPLRLFPAYRELMQAYGFENAPESDLFFPRLTVSPALKAESVHMNADAMKISAKQMGAEYQTGLLKWLRDPSNKDGLQQMADAVNHIETFPGTTEERAFWWVVAGFLENLLQQEGDQIELPIRRLCGKIEQAIRRLAAGTPDSTATLIRELLYHIAHSESASQRITDIKRSYAWPGQLAETDTLTLEQSETLQPILDQLRNILMQTNDIWREFCTGQQESLTSLLEYIDWLKHLSQQTECAPLEKLINIISSTVTDLHAHPQDMSEELIMEMATALLLIESIIDDFAKLSPDLPQQIDALASRLHQITNQSAGEYTLAFNAIESRAQEKLLLAQVAQEILTNLGQIENILDQFFFEPSKRSELSALSTLFQQISGALVMLDLERANTLLDLCRSLIEKLLEPSYEIIEAEQILLVDGLSSLGFFIESLKSGQSDSDQIIEEAIALFQIALLPKTSALATSITTTAESISETQTDTQFIPEDVHQTAVEIPPEKPAVPIESAAAAAFFKPLLPAQSGLDVEDQINQELLPVFLEETQDLLPQINSKLRAWRMLPQDEDIHRTLLRLLHILKGSARMTGDLHLGALIHAMESHVESAFRKHHMPDSALDQLEREFDIIISKIEQLQRNKLSPTAAKQVVIAMAAHTSDNIDPLQSKTLRINSELMDSLVNDSSEVIALRSKIEAQLNHFKQSLQDLAESTHRLHDQLREVEIQAETQMQSHLAQQHENEHAFDSLEFDRFTRFQELTRLMAESIDDIITVQESLRTTHLVAEEAIMQQSIINRHLQQSLLQIRAIPFSNYAERYYRIARQVTEDLGKKAHLEIQGMEVEIDRNVLEEINPSLEHLLRNAIAHGIEEPAQRLQTGKSQTGQVTVHLRQESNEVVITVSDDGYGLNLPRIRGEAQRLGLIQANEALDDDKTMSLIFMPGLSTTDSITGIAGRGIGLDIVKNDISMLGGRISVQSVPNQGTTFTIYLPLMLSMAQTLMVRAGKQIYAIPAFIVEHNREFDSEAFKKLYQDYRVAFNGKTYLFSHLSHLLGEFNHIPVTQRSQVLFLHSGTHYLAIHVDELISNTEVVVKHAGPQLSQAPGIEGATITGGGEIILIMNPVKLLQRNDAQQAFQYACT